MANLNLNLTTVKGTGSVGTVASQKFPTGNTSTGSVGTITSANRSITLSGVSGTGSVGSIVGQKLLSGVSGSGSVGTITVVNPSVTLGLNGVTTGIVTFNQPTFANAAFGALVPNSVASGTAVGSVTSSIAEPDTGITARGSVGSIVSVDKSFALNSVTGISAVGNVTSVNKTFTLNGVTGTGSVGTVEAITGRFAEITGTTAIGSVGTASAALSVSLTGVKGTSSVGSVSSQNFLTGNKGTGVVGTVSTASNIALTGVKTQQTVAVYNWNTFGNASFAALVPDGTQVIGCRVGSVSTLVESSVSITGNTATSSVENVAPFSFSGVTATGSVGNVLFGKQANLTGVVTQQQTGITYNWPTFGGVPFASLAPNTIIYSGCNVGNVSVEKDFGLNGVAGTGSVGSVEARTDYFRNLIGVTGKGSVGKVLIKPYWSLINDAGAANWVPIDTLSSVDVWSTIDTNSNTDWQLVTTEDV
jgi:hypothetical protein